MQTPPTRCGTAKARRLVTTAPTPVRVGIIAETNAIGFTRIHYCASARRPLLS